METLITYGFGIVLLGVAGYLFKETWSYYRQYRLLSDVDPATTPDLTAGATVTIQGTAHVEQPVDYAELPVEYADEDKEPLGLLAWRHRRRKRRRRSSGKGSRRTWTTEDAGLSVGDLSVMHGDEEIRLDADAVRALVPEGFGVDDPWDSNGLHLGSADEIISLGNGNGAMSGVPGNLDINIGPFSSSGREQLELNRIADGDEILVHGRLESNEHGFALTAPESQPLVVGSGPLDTVISELRASMAKYVLMGAVCLIFAIALFGGLADEVEIQ